LQTQEIASNTLRGYVLTALFAAAAAAGGYLLMSVPNVELFTLILFASGYALNFGSGMVAALVASLIYFGLNPQGGLFPPLLASQILGALAAPVAGSIWRGKQIAGVTSAVFMGIAGVVVTFWYDLITNLAYPLTVGFDLRQLTITLIAGIPFAVIHIGSNLLAFALLGPPLFKLIARSRVAA
jgi:hypothetical protein